MKNKQVKQMIKDVYQSMFPDENFGWIYCSSIKSNHFGELVSWPDNSEYPDTVYYGTPISLTANQLKSN